MLLNRILLCVILLHWIPFILGMNQSGQRKKLQGSNLAEAHFQFPRIDKKIMHVLVNHIEQNNHTAFESLLSQKEEYLTDDQIGTLLEQSLKLGRYAIAHDMTIKYPEILEEHIKQAVPNHHTLSAIEIVSFWLLTLNRTT